MTKFTVTMTVVRTIVQSKPVEIEVEADDADEAEEKASIEAEKSQYHDIEEQDWDLDEISSGAQDLEAVAVAEDEEDAE